MCLILFILLEQDFVLVLFSAFGKHSIMYFI